MIKHVSLVGIGVLGKAIALRLRQCQYDISLYNRTASKAEALAGDGINAVSSVSQLFTRQHPIILICLTDAQAIHELFCTTEIERKLQDYQPVIVNVSTIGPQDSRQVGDFFLQHGAHYLEAPVSGGPEGARTGKLACWTGPIPAAFSEALTGLLSSLCGDYAVMESNCAAQTMKVINNYCEAVHLLVAAESLLLAEKSGISPEALEKALPLGRGRSTYMGVMLNRYLHPSDKISVPLAIRIKDLELANTLFHQCAVHSAFFEHAQHIYLNTAAELSPPQDQTRCFDYLSKQTPQTKTEM
ncbi:MULTISPECIES: NAD(P)-dependent oxidoreductase [Lonsdalea]|uniref:2-hydroxy-3-oxopropionate reductase n=2 Tax=Lonsdalea TaxID=1082702 RepID=A0ACD1JHF1_9GAMM|nr:MULTISPECIES: NAD(P)-dependent oxidoreductase [Lonsdalea]OSN01931.1 2-hydroxy-3-oxopropionate reductase [Lonsdalea populi]QPQ23988.1 NAD(P)-dependent oxidoreductase [Lonsdalea populi]RAT16636.1 2-hydroxy-3-oxopropionate reductase [Lonsdalea quercina]RAT16781.1 2-hydroxy-3-oxopropionate reductase [Lonsdalea quercina]RAT22793.1 2-hydroxy-3-oxopropionate reductase [Lonsdalea populi]